MAPVHKKKLPKFFPPLVTSGFPFFSSLVTLLAGGISRALAYFGRLTNPEKIEGTLVVITYLTNFMLDIAHSKREIQLKRIYQSLTNKPIAIYQAERELINHWSDYKCRSGLCYITYTYEQLLNVYKVEIARLPSRHSFMFGAHVG